MRKISEVGKYFTLMMLFCGLNFCYGQTAVIRKNKISAFVTEKYNTIITSDRQIKQGQYQAFYKNKVVVAQGMYKNDERVGLWRFFNKTQQLTQVYNYDTGKLLFELPEDERSGFKYVVDKVITDSIVTTKPYRIGGRYFGYLSYLKFLSVPEDLRGEAFENIDFTLELFVSPMGRVADFKFHIIAPYYKRTINIDPNRLLPEDRTFTPATYNKQPISSRIVISGYINNRGEPDMD